nr:DEAD/DEAH box helicase family protein [Bifidobacterium saguinibicoloris]
MRQPIYNKPRIIYRGEETDKAILLPRGCKESLDSLLDRIGTTADYRNERNPGKRIQVEFAGTLYERQNAAAQNLLAHDDGILIAPTGFGKTVIAAYLIAERKTNTLIVLRSSALLEQWRGTARTVPRHHCYIASPIDRNRTSQPEETTRNRADRSRTQRTKRHHRHRIGAITV